MKRRLFFIALMAFSFASNIFAQSNTEVTVQDKPEHVGVFYTGDAVTLPSDFPVFNNTGNPDKDNVDYSNAVDKWIAQHPDEYKALLDRNTQSWKEKNPEEYNDYIEKSVPEVDNSGQKVIDAPVEMNGNLIATDNENHYMGITTYIKINPLNENEFVISEADFNKLSSIDQELVRSTSNIAVIK